MTHEFTKSALVVSACQARQCHPETCCCGDTEGAIFDYKPRYNRPNETYYGVVMYGERKDLEQLLENARKNNSLKDHS